MHFSHFLANPAKFHFIKTKRKMFTIYFVIISVSFHVRFSVWNVKCKIENSNQKKKNGKK